MASIREGPPHSNRANLSVDRHPPTLSPCPHSLPASSLGGRCAPALPQPPIAVSREGPVPVASGSHVWLNAACSASCMSSRLLLRHPVASSTEILSTGAEVHIAKTRLSRSKAKAKGVWALKHSRVPGEGMVAIQAEKTVSSAQMELCGQGHCPGQQSRQEGTTRSIAITASELGSNRNLSH